MDRYNFLRVVWDITETYSHHITTELLAIVIADKYVLLRGYSYNKELAYAVSIIAAKINEEGHGLKSMKTASSLLGTKSIYYMEHDILKTIALQSTFVTQLSLICSMLNINKLSDSFVFLLRYLEWCDLLQYNLFTILLSIQLLIKTKQFPISHYMKFFKVYTMFYELSELYDIHMCELITLYNKKI